MNIKIIKFILIPILLLIAEFNINVRSEDIKKVNSPFIPKNSQNHEKK